MTTSFNWILQSVNIWYCPGKGYHLLPLIPSIWMGMRWRMWLFMESFKTLEFWSTTNSPGPITLQGSAVEQERVWACSLDSFIKTPLQTPLSSCTWVLSVHIWDALPNLGIHILMWHWQIRFTLHVNGFSYDELLNIVSTPRLQERRLHLKLAQVYKIVHGLGFATFQKQMHSSYSDRLARPDTVHCPFAWAVQLPYYHWFVPSSIRAWNSLEERQVRWYYIVWIKVLNYL